MVLSICCWKLPAVASIMYTRIYTAREGYYEQQGNEAMASQEDTRLSAANSWLPASTEVSHGESRIPSRRPAISMRREGRQRDAGTLHGASLHDVRRRDGI